MISRKTQRHKQHHMPIASLDSISVVCTVSLGIVSPYVRRSWYHPDDVIKWKQFPRYWPFVRRTHRSPVDSLHKGQWRGALMFSLICACINGWVKNREAGDLRRHRAHYDVIIMLYYLTNSPGHVHSVTLHHSWNGKDADEIWVFTVDCRGEYFIDNKV